MTGNNYNGERIHGNSVSSGIVRVFRSCNFSWSRVLSQRWIRVVQRNIFEFYEELKYGIGNVQLNDILDFTPSYLQLIENQFHTDSNYFPEI